MALKDKLMTLEDFKAVRDVDVASNSAQFTEIKADLGALMEPQRLADGTDLNTVTTPGTYTIHTGWTYTNKPTSDAEHGILEVWHEDFDNNLGRVFQRLTYTYKAGRTCMEIWTRSLGVSTMTWTPWVSVVNADELNQKIDALMEPQRLADGTDLNNVTTPGTYTLHTSVTYTNKPTEDAEHGILEVWHEDFDNNLGRVFQRLTYTYKAGRTQTEIWARSKATTTAEAIWTPWISTTGDLTRKSMLLSDDVPNTTQSYTFTNGKVSQVTHSRNSVAIRTDAFTYGTGTITEVRTLNTGESLTIVTNLTTLETIVTYNGGV